VDQEHVEAYDVCQEEGKINERLKGSANRMLIFLSCCAVFWVTQGSKKGEMVDETYIRQFLRHPDGSVVWAHPTAYQDTPGLAMWCDLVMGPARVKSGRRRWLLVWDNVKAHAVNSVLSVFDEWGISVRFLPKGMTDILQPVDLVRMVQSRHTFVKSAVRSSTTTSRNGVWMLWMPWCPITGVPPSSCNDGGGHCSYCEC